MRRKPLESIRGARALVLLLPLLLCAGGTPAQADERWLLHGLFDAELWDTDDGSRLLSKNEGDTAAAGVLRLWAVTEPVQQLRIVLLGEFSGGNAQDEDGVESELEQAYVRYSFGKRMLVEAGRIVTPIGDFPARHLSPVNPLIGAPTGYEVDYPVGVQWAGAVSLLDFRLAVVDGPLGNTAYVPEPDSAARPALSLGLTPVVGLRFGGYYTGGPYLNADVDLGVVDASWRDFSQEVAGGELQFSRGHFELHADYNVSRFDVPGYDDTLEGNAVYVEPKYTWSPRWFTAVRLEKNEYVYVGEQEYGLIARVVRVDDVEIGTGYRFGRDTLLKISYRFDDWHVSEEESSFLPDGQAFAVQFSRQFDVRGWFDRPR